MQSEADIERLLTALRGVRSSRVIMASDGRIVEIHVLSTPEFHPKQVVRNVESALSAGLRVDVDRRIISVGQLDENMPVPEPFAEPESEPPEATVDASPGDGVARPGAERPALAPGFTASRSGLGDARVPRERDVAGAGTPGESGLGGGLVIPIRPATHPVPAERVRFVGIRTHTHSAHSVACEVRLALDGREYVGREEAPDTEGGRLGAAARATFAALEDALGEAPALLEGVSAVDADAGRYALVLARGFSGRERVPLVGTARMRGAVEDAAVLATLQALDRWLTSDLVAG